MNANDLFKAAMELNLDAIKTKLMHAESGEGWSQEKVDAVEKEYRRFLCLMKLYPDESTAPLVDVDTFWHYHILDTMKYAQDCEQMFGYFLHHYPYVGLRGGNDEQVRVDSGERMKTLYENTFGEAYPVAALGGSESATATSYCGGPWPDKAGFNITGIRLGTAYCGGPWPDKAGRKSNAITISAATAYCGGPWPDKAGAMKAAPAATTKTATAAIGAATAYCGGPWPDKAGGATADTGATTAKQAHSVH